MKSLKLLLITAVLVFTSCNIEPIDGDEPIDTQTSIVGTWKMIDYSYSGKTVTSGQGQTLTSDFVGEAFDINNTITFTENPNNLTSEGSFGLRVTTTLLGQTSTQSVSGLEAVESGTWEIQGNELITVANGEEGRMKIETLTETLLVLSVKEEENLSQGGFTVTVNIDATVSLERK